MRRALGVRSRREAEYAGENLQPVVIAADMSSTFAPEQVEARKMFLRRLWINGTTLDYQVHCRGAGGMVVEYLELSSDVATALLYFAIGTTALCPAGVVDGGLNIGGSAVNSEMRYGLDSGTPVGTPALLWYAAFVLPSMRIYVPPGYYLKLRVEHPAPPAAFYGYFAGVYREIPEILGAP
jgi:hypothetical protein